MHQADDRQKKSQLWQVIFSAVYLLIFPVGLFYLAGDWHWTEGWIFSIIFCGLTFAIVVYLYFTDPALLNERFGSPIQKNQKAWDKILLSSFFCGCAAWFAIMPLDAKRFGWSPRFSLEAEISGALVFILGFVVVLGAFKENTFAAPVIKMQKERGQKVISSGLYSIVRHPMYLGAGLIFTGAPLLVGSLYGLAAGILLTVVLGARSIGEEKMLSQELEGYEAYRQKVRWRLIPLIF